MTTYGAKDKVRITKNDKRRFWGKVAIREQDDCWRWKGTFYRSGYGSFWLNGKNHFSHRIAYIIEKGEIPEGLQIRHTCDNRWCVNPAHLLVGTLVDNMQDRFAHGDAYLNCKPPHPIGGAHPNSKLNEDKVREARYLRENGWSYHRLAKRYKVDATTIKLAVIGETWSHVE